MKIDKKVQARKTESVIMSKKQISRSWQEVDALINTYFFIPQTPAGNCFPIAKHVGEILVFIKKKHSNLEDEFKNTLDNYFKIYRIIKNYSVV